MTRFQKLAAATVATTFILVVIGVLVRATNSGVACPSWPGCFPGQFLPGFDAGANVWIEWTHRAGTIGQTRNPVTGCDRISAGCDNCYALTLARRLKERYPHLVIVFVNSGLTQLASQ